MRAERDDIRLAPERRNYTMPIAIGAVLILAILLYIGLRDSDEQLLEAAAETVLRDSAIVEPPVVDTTQVPAQLQGAPENTAVGSPRGDFNERQLPPAVDTVGAGEAQISDMARGERIVIDGALLQELEEDAQVRAGDASPNQLRTPQ
jgi:hypothetical protein